MLQVRDPPKLEHATDVPGFVELLHCCPEHALHAVQLSPPPHTHEHVLVCVPVLLYPQSCVSAPFVGSLQESVFQAGCVQLGLVVDELHIGFLVDVPHVRDPPKLEHATVEDGFEASLHPPQLPKLHVGFVDEAEHVTLLVWYPQVPQVWLVAGLDVSWQLPQLPVLHVGLVLDELQLTVLTWYPQVPQVWFVVGLPDSLQVLHVPGDQLPLLHVMLLVWYPQLPQLWFNTGFPDVEQQLPSADVYPLLHDHEQLLLVPPLLV